MEARELRSAPHIVVVDDSEEMRSLCRDFLSSFGYRITLFNSAGAAWEKLSGDPDFAQTVDVILSDVHMPGLDGNGLLKKIRQALPRIPVVLMTAYGSKSGREAAYEQGAHAYISKPFQLKELRHTLEKAYQKNR